MSDNNDDEAGQDRGWAEVYATLNVSLVIAAVVYIIFEYLLRRSGGRTPVYGGNYLDSARQKPAGSADRREHEPLELPERPRSVFGWLQPVLTVGGGMELLDLVGLDAYVMLRFLKMQARICGFSALCGLLILVPTYSTGGEDLDDEFYQWNASNLEDGSGKFWACAVLMCVYTAHVFLELEMEYRVFIKCRARFFSVGTRDTSPQSRYSAIVEDLPPQMRSAAAVGAYFDFLFPDAVHSVSLCVDTKALQKLTREREDVVAALEDLYLYEAAHPDKSPVLQRPKADGLEASAAVVLGDDGAKAAWSCCGLCGPAKVSKREYLEHLLDAYNGRILQLQQEAIAALDFKDEEAAQLLRPAAPEGGAESQSALLAAKKDELDAGIADIGSSVMQRLGSVKNVVAADDSAVSSTAFVTFKSLLARQAACQVLLSNGGDLQALPAPEPKEVLWHDVHKPLADMQKRRELAGVLFLVFTIFFSIPVAACASASLDNIAEVITPLQSFEGQYWYVLLGTYLPTIASLALLAAVPIVMKLTAEYFEFYKGRTLVQSVVFERYFNIQLAYIWISLFSGSVFTALADIIDDPASVLSILGSSIPGTSVYFMNVLVVKTFQGAILELSRIVPYVLYAIKSHGDETMLGERSLERRDATNSIEYGTLMPQFLMTGIIGFCFEIVCPFMQVICFLYYAISYVVFKHQTIYVYARPSESGGDFFFPTFKRTVSGLYVGQVVLTGYLGIRQAAGPAVVSLLLLPVSAYLASGLKRRFERPASILSFETAASNDEGVGATGQEGKYGAPEEVKRPAIIAYDASLPLIDHRPFFERETYVQPELRSLEPVLPKPSRWAAHPEARGTAKVTASA